MIEFSGAYISEIRPIPRTQHRFHRVGTHNKHCYAHAVTTFARAFIAHTSVIITQTYAYIAHMSAVIAFLKLGSNYAEQRAY